MDSRAVAEERPRASLLRRFLRDLGLFMLIVILNSVLGFLILLLGRAIEVILPAWLVVAPQALATVFFVWFFYVRLRIRSGPSR
jgi:hypothetical protein